MLLVGALKSASPVVTRHDGAVPIAASHAELHGWAVVDRYALTGLGWLTHRVAFTIDTVPLRAGTIRAKLTDRWSKDAVIHALAFGLPTGAGTLALAVVAGRRCATTVGAKLAVSRPWQGQAVVGG